MVELSNGSGSPHFQYRFEVIRDIEEGYNYYTAELHEGKIRPKEHVVIVAVEGEKYLRIDSESLARDDLGSVPEI